MAERRGPTDIPDDEDRQTMPIDDQPDERQTMPEGDPEVTRADHDDSERQTMPESPGRAEMPTLDGSSLPHDLGETVESDTLDKSGILRSLSSEQTIQDLGMSEHGVPTLPKGTVVGKYTIEKVLGVGGMGAVYRAEQEKPHRKVALKLIRSGLMSRKALRRFDLEAEILGRLHHPNIAAIHEAGIDVNTGSPYFAMEHVEGRELTYHIQRHKLDTRAKVTLFCKLCDAIQHAHSKGVIHRDLKPGNVLVSDDGEPKVLDFGVARAADSGEESQTMQTNEGQLVGTLYYMSPEQAIGDIEQIDTRSDIYALGVVIYEMLTGSIPYEIERKPLHEAVRLIRESDPGRMSRYGSDLRGDLEIIINKALEKDRDRRYQSAADLAADLRRYLNHEPISARRASTVYKASRFVRRNKALTISTAVITIVASVGGGFAVNQWAERVAERRLALDNMLTGLSEMDVQKGGLNGPDLARRLLDLYAENGPGIFSADKAGLAQFYSRLGSAYHGYEDYTAAIGAYDKQLEYAVEAFGEGSLEVTSAHVNIARASFFLKDYERARDHYTTSLDIRDDLFGDNDPDAAETARTTEHLGATLTMLGEFDKAQPYYTKAKAMRISLFGPNSVEVAQSNNSLAWFYSRSGREADAIPIYKENIELLRNLEGDDEKPLWLARSLHSYGTKLASNGLLESARMHLLEGAELKELLLKSSSSTALTLYVLAGVEYQLGMLPEAKAHAEKALTMWNENGSREAARAEELLDEIRTQMGASEL